MLEAFQSFGFEFFLGGGLDCRIVSLAVFAEVPQDARQFVRHAVMAFGVPSRAFQQRKHWPK